MEKRNLFWIDYVTHSIDEWKGQTDAITEGMNVIVHDDLLATGGTAAAAAELITRQGGNIAGFNFIINLSFLEGDRNLIKYSKNIDEIIKY